jgi:colanic acid/amylovoran biosynthesis glycosyltransferase
LKALKVLKDSSIDFRYRIVGEGDYRPQIEAEICALGLQENVEFLGTMSESDIAAELARSDVMLLNSINLGEAAPVSVMEAMAAGIPAIVSIIGGTPDMITHGVDGFLVPQQDVDAIADCLKRLAGDRLLGKRMGKAARERAEKEFDSRVLARGLLELIRSQHSC